MLSCNTAAHKYQNMDLHVLVLVDIQHEFSNDISNGVIKIDTNYEKTSDSKIEFSWFAPSLIQQSLVHAVWFPSWIWTGVYLIHGLLRMREDQWASWSHNVSADPPCWRSLCVFLLYSDWKRKSWLLGSPASFTSIYAKESGSMTVLALARTT